MKNHEYVTRCLTLLNKDLVRYVYEGLHNYFGEHWWNTGVYNTLPKDKQRDLPCDGADEKLKCSLDLSLCLRLLDVHWKNVFGENLNKSCRIYIREIINIRNRWAHVGVNDFTEEETLRMLETITLFANEININNGVKDTFLSYKDSVFIKRIVIPIKGEMFSLILGSTRFPYMVSIEEQKIYIREILIKAVPLLSIPIQAAYLGLRKVTTKKPFILNLELKPIRSHGRIISFECSSNKMLEFFKESSHLKFKDNILEIDFNYFEQVNVNKTGEILNYYFKDNSLFLELGKT